MAPDSGIVLYESIRHPYPQLFFLAVVLLYITLHEKINGVLRLDGLGTLNINFIMHNENAYKRSLEYKRMYYQIHKKRLKAASKARYEKNKEEILRKRAERRANDEEYAAKTIAYSAAYYLKKKAERKAARAAAKREEQS